MLAMLLSSAAFTPSLSGGARVNHWPAGQPLACRLPLMAARKNSRFADDGTREKGLNLIDDEKLGSGFFSNFKFGTEVEVKTSKPKKGASKKVIGDGAGSDRGLGGNQAYRNTESARLRGSSDEGQRIRNQKLEAYLDNDLESADKTFGKIIAGSLILTLIALLAGVISYYGIDGMIAVGNGRSG